MKEVKRRKSVTRSRRPSKRNAAESDISGVVQASPHQIRAMTRESQQTSMSPTIGLSAGELQHCHSNTAKTVPKDRLIWAIWLEREGLV